LAPDQVDVHLLQAGAGQVHVGVIESGHDEVTIEIDNLGLWPFNFMISSRVPTARMRSPPPPALRALARS
jgi:hypothetical protein